MNRPPPRTPCSHPPHRLRRRREFRAHRRVIVRIGPAGCVLAMPGAEVLRVPAFDVRAVDSNGAGDAHVGVFVAGLAEGLSPARAALRANAAAAIAVTRRGPATAPTRTDVDRLLDGA
ncbi:PfkB family carbohydrate kinase [Actinoallomurus sp. CA-150999]|uniref:PfkB family carbohydrate kinase n=1 Tax=Actinoallomurus sp. CA-150999 TaxID=3239887 RepID=UPI003D8D4A00